MRQPDTAGHLQSDDTLRIGQPALEISVSDRKDQHAIGLLERELVRTAAVQQQEVAVAKCRLASLLARHADAVELQTQQVQRLSGPGNVLTRVIDHRRLRPGLSEPDVPDLRARQACGERLPVQGVTDQGGECVPGELVPVVQAPGYRHFGRRERFEHGHCRYPLSAGNGRGVVNRNGVRGAR